MGFNVSLLCGQKKLTQNTKRVSLHNKTITNAKVQKTEKTNKKWAFFLQNVHNSSVVDLTGLEPVTLRM